VTGNENKANFVFRHLSGENNSKSI